MSSLRLSITLSLIAVFLPILLMGGVVGRVFNAFAATVSLAVAASCVVSLTLTPLMASRLKAHHKPGRLDRGLEIGFQAIERAYGWLLDRALRFRPLVWVVFLASVGAAGWLAVNIPKGFFPVEDTGLMVVNTEGPRGVSVDGMAAMQNRTAEILSTSPHIASVVSNIGASAGSASINQGRLFVELKPTSERPPMTQVIQELRRQVNVVPGLRVFISNPPVINIGGRSSKSEYQFTLQSSDIEGLYQGSAALEQRLQQVPGLRDVTSDLQIKNPQVQVAIDRDRAAALGIDVNQIESALYNAYGARQVSTIYTPNDQYWVVMELLPQYQRDLSAMNLLHLSGREGVSVPLGSLAKVTPSTGPLTVNHSGQLPSVTLSFNLLPGTSIGTAVERVEAAAREVLPSTISASFAGTAQAFQAAQQGLLVLLVLAILVIYLVLGILYESFVHPLTILSGLPFAGFGALVALMVFQLDLSIYAFVGVIMLVGIVKKNAIMMIDFAVEAERHEGTTARQAILQAASVRFRPIMMTTMAALVGTLPIALGQGAGAESRRPLGVAVVGGLLFSQIITLYITPVVYTYLDAWQKRLARRRGTESREYPEPRVGEVRAAGAAG